MVLAGILNNGYTNNIGAIKRRVKKWRMTEMAERFGSFPWED
jgi:hypothetical protein